MRTDRQKRAWHLVNPLAYDIAARLGGIVPRTRPTRFYLNGEPQGVYVMTERTTPEFFETRFGHGDFDIGPLAGRRWLLDWARAEKALTIRKVEAAVDPTI